MLTRWPSHSCANISGSPRFAARNTDSSTMPSLDHVWYV
jgi:hypothetical protein